MEPIIGGEQTTAYPEAVLLNMRAVSGQGYACSAVLLAPTVVLTAGHCVDGMASWDAYAGGVHATATRGETYDWHENGATTVNPAHHDLGLVYLDQPITIPSYPTIATAPLADGSPALDVGRIDNGVLTNSFYGAPVDVADAAVFGYAFDYISNDVIEHGDSGGPVFALGTHTLVAVNSGANTAVEVLARVDLLAGWLAQRIAAAAGPGAAGSSAPDAGGAPDSGETQDAGGAPDSGGTPDAGGAPDSGAAPDSGGAPNQGGRGPAAEPLKSGVCAADVEPNDTPSQANTLSKKACGTLAAGDDVDWFVFAAGFGSTRVTLSPAVDAVLGVGYLTPQSTCSVVIPASARQRAVEVTVAGAASDPPVSICVSVSSPGQVAQRYALSLGR